MKIDFPLRHDHQRPDLVDPVDVVSVGMGEQNGVDPVNSKAKHLIAQIWRHIDEDLGLGAIATGSLDKE
jgi:hypothetical protein